MIEMSPVAKFLRKVVITGLGISAISSHSVYADGYKRLELLVGEGAVFLIPTTRIRLGIKSVDTTAETCSFYQVSASPDNIIDSTQGVLFIAAKAQSYDFPADSLMIQLTVTGVGQDTAKKGTKFCYVQFYFEPIYQRIVPGNTPTVIHPPPPP